MPGAIVLIDEQCKRILPGPWRRESERPIYFLQTRGGYVCCWCARERRILQPHHLSPEPLRIVDAEQTDIVGQVVGVAMRFDSFIANSNDGR